MADFEVRDGVCLRCGSGVLASGAHIRFDLPPCGGLVADLHPEPVETYLTDHRDTENRAQMREPSHLHGIWKRAVEGLAAELQIHPMEARRLLLDAAGEDTIGLAWYWWDD